MKENKKNNALDKFLSKNETELEENLNVREKHIKDNNSIIERVDKIIIVESGKQLLREQY